MSEAPRPTINEVRARLDEIAAAVSDESIDLETALGLYEEAVTLGLAACELSAAELTVDEADGDAAGTSRGDGAAAGSVPEAANVRD